MSSEDAELIRLGENAIFRLHDKPLVVRIGRAPEKLPVVRQELCVARWLADRRVPVTCPYEGVTQPIVLDGHPVSVWHLVVPGEPRPGVVDPAALLRQIHALGDCPCELQPLDPLATAVQRLHHAHALAEQDRKFLLERTSELRQAFRELTFALPQGFIHGDAHTGNLLGMAGRAVLSDFEAVAIGPREWDLTAIAMAQTRFGLPAATYRRFVDGYGFDVTTWSGYPVLRKMRELYMTAWLAQNLGHGPDVAAEVNLRITSIRNGDTTSAWHPF